MNLIMHWFLTDIYKQHWKRQSEGLRSHNLFQVPAMDAKTVRIFASFKEGDVISTCVKDGKLEAL